MDFLVWIPGRRKEMVAMVSWIRAGTFINFINLFFFDILETMAFKASTVDSWIFWSSRMSSISSCSPQLNLNCRELPLLFSRCALPFFSEVPYTFGRFDFALLRIIYQNIRTSSVDYQQVAKLPHFGVSFRG